MTGGSLVPNVPILIVLAKKEDKEEEDIVLGIDGIFDFFEITFKKAQNKIILKRSFKNLFSRKIKN
ncbi:MAG: hypothetical protein V1740_04375 [Candidatus Woesearchaeota archaeon]